MFVINLMRQECPNALRKIRFMSCWSCAKDTDVLVHNLFCSNCNALQKPDKKNNYFKILGVQETYDLKENILAKKYKELQKYLHPDKFANRDQKEQEISVLYSALVNEAYMTLLQPLTRGSYMLKLKGKELPEDTDIDQTFLKVIMQKNEEVQEAETEEEIMKLSQENKKQLQKLQSELSKAFGEGDMENVCKLLSHMKYYSSIDNHIQETIRKMGIIR